MARRRRTTRATRMIDAATVTPSTTGTVSARSADEPVDEVVEDADVVDDLKIKVQLLEIECGYLADVTYADVEMTVEVASEVMDEITEVKTDDEGGCVAVDATHSIGIKTLTHKHSHRQQTCHAHERGVACPHVALTDNAHRSSAALSKAG